MTGERDHGANNAAQQRELLRGLLLHRASQPIRAAASCAQRRLWLVDQLERPNASYNNPCHLTIRGSLDPALLEESINRLVARHDVLRTTFVDEDGSPFQVIAPESRIDLPCLDLSASGDADTTQRVADIIAQESAFIFDLASGPLLRVKLLQTRRARNSVDGENEFVLIIVLHHIISDGWSIGVMTADLFAIYDDLKNNGNGIEPLPLQYSDFARRQARWLESVEFRRQSDYWQRQLRNLPTLELRTDFLRPAVKRFEGASLFSRIDESVAISLRELCARQSVTLSMLLSAAFSLLLHRYTGQQDIVFGSPIANRNQPDIEQLIGCFVNMLVIRNRVEPADSFSRLLASTRETLVDAYSNRDLPFEVLVDQLQPLRDRSRNPLFQVLFAMQNEAMPAIEPDGLKIGRPVVPGYDRSEYRVATKVTRFDIELHCWEDGGGLRCTWIYDTALFAANTIERMRRHFSNLLTAVAARPDEAVELLPMLDERERDQIIHQSNAARTSFAADRSIAELFEQRVAALADSIALEYRGATLSYAAMNARANQIAHYLRARGVGAEVIVGLCLERSLELPVALAGILKAGGAYLPLDPEYPQSRLKFMLEDAGAALLLTTSSLRARLDLFAENTICLDSQWDAIGKESSDDPVPAVTAENLAYVIYTSGSTGRPKGVMVTHGNVTRLFAATAQWFDFGARDVWTMFHSSAFDFSVWEIWGALLHGGRLVIVPYATSRSPELFRELLAQAGVTVLNQTPSAFSQLIKADADKPAESLAALRLVIFGGEALNPQSLRPWFEKHGDRQPQLVNMYGITETTVHVSYRPLTSTLAESGASLIGRALPDLQIFILDRNRQPVPVGVPGEMYIGGAGLARGYLNRPQLSAERFVDNPFSERPGERLYRSGDLARYRADGDIEYLGRADQQVKLRGFRIELGEIEAALLRAPGIDGAVAVLHGDAPANQRLVAYLVAAGGAAPRPAELRARLRAELPDYMLPAVFVTLDALPLNANGKIDRGALPAPQNERAAEEGYLAPGTPFEQLLVEIWEEVLNLRPIGVHDNFFELGGHSLNATRVVNRIGKRLERQLPVAALFSHPDIASLARQIEMLQLVEAIKTDCPITTDTDRAGEREEFRL